MVFPLKTEQITNLSATYRDSGPGGLRSGSWKNQTDPWRGWM